MKKLFAIIMILTMVISFAACGGNDKSNIQLVKAEGMNVEHEINVEPATKKTFDERHTYIINGQRQQVMPYYPIEDNFVMTIVELGYTNFHIYNSRNVTGEMLTNRTESDKIIVERVIAIITNKEREGDAKVLNTNGDYTYISYYGTDLDYTTGTIMITYLMYNPETDYEDDIIERYDYVLDRNFED